MLPHLVVMGMSFDYSSVKLIMISGGVLLLSLVWNEITENNRSNIFLCYKHVLSPSTILDVHALFGSSVLQCTV